MRLFEFYHSAPAPVQLAMLAAIVLLPWALLAAIIAAIAHNLWILLGLVAMVVVSCMAVAYARAPEDGDR